MPIADCGLRIGDCRLKGEDVVFQSAIHHPQPPIDRAVPSDVPNLVLPVGVVSFEHWLDLNA